MLLELGYKDDEMTFIECVHVYFKSDKLLYLTDFEKGALEEVNFKYLKYAMVNGIVRYEQTMYEEDKKRMTREEFREFLNDFKQSEDLDEVFDGFVESYLNKNYSEID